MNTKLKYVQYLVKEVRETSRRLGEGTEDLLRLDFLRKVCADCIRKRGVIRPFAFDG